MQLVGIGLIQYGIMPHTEISIELGELNMKSEKEYLEILEKSRTEYYNIGSSTLSDQEYDEIYDSFKKDFPNNTFFKKVGSDENTHWKKVKHIFNLGSLSKVNTEEDFIKWNNNLNTKDLVLEEKLDGMSIALTYKNGELISAVTRGNGYEGEDILRNVLKMKYVPNSIKIVDCTLRAEIIMTRTDFNSLPIELHMKNPRNATTGIAKSLDGTYCKYLSVILTEILSSKENRINIKNYEDFGFKHVPVWNVSSSAEVITRYHSYIDKERKNLDYDIDGLVIKTNKVMNDEWEHPKFQIALKFPNQYKSTILRDVIWQYKGNRITPVGIFDPIELAGATVSRATLNNIELIEEMGLKIGSKIEVCRANEIIPKIQSVLIPGTISILPPSKCPVCHSKIIRDGKYFYCSNNDCDSKATNKIIKWLEAHGCKGIALSTIESLYENDIITSLTDFLTLPEDNPYFEIEGFGDRKKEILFGEIRKNRNTTILKFMDGLDFKDMGTKKWSLILNYITNELNEKTISIIQFLNYIGLSNNLVVIKGIADETNKKIKESYNKNIELIHNLLEIVNVEDYKIIKKENNMKESKVTGKSFCFTGKLNTMERADAQSLVELSGGINKSGVTSSLNYLVTNELSSSTKSKKAIELGITVINEEEFLEMLKI